MALVGLVSALVTILAGGWVAVRLLALARRSGELPERVLGLGMVAFAGLAYPMFLVGLLGSGHLPRGAQLGALVLAHLGYWGCLVSLAIFTRVVFRPKAAWALLAVVALTLLEASGAAMSLVHSFGGAEARSYADPIVRASGAMISASFTLLFFWTSIEAATYRRALAKRLALGLADPVVVNRMGVWAIGTGVACLVDFGLVVCNGMGLDPRQTSLPALLQSASGLSCALTWLLTFAPSESYLAWVRRRAAGTGEGR
jgi:hypothetical protein